MDARVARVVLRPGRVGRCRLGATHPPGLARSEETIGAWLSRVAARALPARQRPREREVSLTSGAPPRGEGEACSSHAIARRQRARHSASAAEEGYCRVWTARGMLVTRDRDSPAATRSVHKWRASRNRVNAFSELGAASADVLGVCKNWDNVSWQGIKSGFHSTIQS